MFKFRVTTRAALLFVLMALFGLSNATATEVNNCCSVDRQCVTDNEWVAGYYAHQNNQCGAPSQTVQLATASQTQPQTETSEAVDNCCFSGWHCNADEEWVSGYLAFQHNHCAMQSHWEQQMRKRQNGNRQPRQSGNQQRKGVNGFQGPQGSSDDQGPQGSGGNQPSSNQGPGWTASNYKSKQCTTRDDGILVCLVTLSSWEEYWRGVCRTYPDSHEKWPECR